MEVATGGIPLEGLPPERTSWNHPCTAPHPGAGWQLAAESELQKYMQQPTKPPSCVHFIGA
jgi:hypothetical protein